MLLPQALPPPEDQTLLGITKAKEIDQSLINREVTRQLLPSLPSLVDELRSIALSPDAKDSDKLTALINILDRVAGKPSQAVKVSGVIGNVVLTQDEVEQKLAHLRGDQNI